MRGLLVFPLLILLVLVAALPGCAKREPPVDEGELNLRRIMQAYHFSMEPHGRPPRKVEDIKRQFKEIGETRDPDVILRSPRDGEPYVILFGHPFEALDRNTILAYEQKGKDGKRYVLTLSRDVKILSDEEFASARFAGDHKPAPPK